MAGRNDAGRFRNHCHTRRLWQATARLGDPDLIAAVDRHLGNLRVVEELEHSAQPVPHQGTDTICIEHAGVELHAVQSAGACRSAAVENTPFAAPFDLPRAHWVPAAAVRRYWMRTALAMAADKGSATTSVQTGMNSGVISKGNRM